MTKKKERKTDRRTLYTRMVIKDAFLKLKSSLAYNDITISKICTEAEISRGTFYLHYDNIRQVLDEVLDDALKSVHGPVGLLEPDNGTEECRLYTAVVDRFAAAAKDVFVKKMLERASITKDACEAMFYFQISGCLAVCKRNIGREDSLWCGIQCVIDRMLREGLKKI